jgi:type IV pilus assembly protein PilQ
MMNITRTLKASLAAICLIAFGDASARSLIGLDYSVMTGNTVQVVFTFDENAVAPRTFTIDEPARIALDFGETENKLEQRNMQVGIGAMQSIISAASKNRTRVVLNLSQKTNYTTSVSGNQVTLTLAGGDQVELPDSGAETQAATTASASDTASASTAPVVSIAKGVTNVDFKRGPNGEGRVVIDLTSATISTDVWRENNVVHVELIGSQLPRELQRRMDVSDFATPIDYVDSIQEDSNIRMSIVSNTDFEHLAYQTDRVYTIEVAPISKEEEEKKKKEKFGFRRTPVAQLPGHRGSLGVATAGRLHRPQPGGFRFGRRQPHPALEKRPLGPGDGYHSQDQGPGSTQGGQRHPDRAHRRNRSPGKTRTRSAQAGRGTRTPAYRVYQGQLRQGGRHGRTAQAKG